MLGFVPLPAGYFGALLGLAVAYLVLVEVGKFWFYRHSAPGPTAPRVPIGRRHVRRHATRFSTGRSAPTAAKPTPGPSALVGAGS